MVLITKRLQAAIAVAAIVVTSNIIYFSKRNHQPDKPLQQDADDLFQTDFQRVFHNRHNLAEKICKERLGYYGNYSDDIGLDTSFFEYTFYYEKFNALFCIIPKVASTNLKEALKELFNLDNFGQHHDHQQSLPQLTPEKLKQVIKTATKIIFVRHPLNRLVSAWHDRFYVTKEVTYKMMAVEIKRKYRKTGNNPFSNDSVSLEEFVKFLLDHVTGKIMQDVHWRSYFEHCQVCRVGYDIIGKFENLDSELKFVFEKIFHHLDVKLRQPAQSSLARIQKRTSANTSISLTKHFLSVVPKDHLAKIVKIYQNDFDMFGYNKYF